MTKTTTTDPKGLSPRRFPLPDRSEPTTESTLAPALTEAVALALAGDWSGAERAVHDGFRALPPALLPHAYIAAVALVHRLLADATTAERPGAVPAIAMATRRPVPTSPRLLTVDPALNYAHAVLTALRGRLAGGATPVRQAS